MWSMIEVHLNIVCASLPALWRWFWNLAGASWKMLVDRHPQASISSNRLAKRVIQHTSRKDRPSSYYQLQDPEENRMMHEILFTPIPPLTHTKPAVVSPGGDTNLTNIEEEGYYNVFAWKPPYQRAHRGW